MKFCHFRLVDFVLLFIHFFNWLSVTPLWGSEAKCYGIWNSFTELLQLKLFLIVVLCHWFYFDLYIPITLLWIVWNLGKAKYIYIVQLLDFILFSLFSLLICVLYAFCIYVVTNAHLVYGLFIQRPANLVCHVRAWKQDIAAITMWLSGVSLVCRKLMSLTYLINNLCI